MPRFRKRPVEVEAMQYTGKNVPALHEFCKDIRISGGIIGNLYVIALEGLMNVSEGDWIVKGVAGEFYPVRPDIFEQTYEVIDE